ncbi:hypothetical protein [Aliiglaciecola sp. LCG003]|uniref:hypothetical protein n=1 Tax=Aliiglaciecola sp. LCG003 TaxID=3053655 RepID=UPI002572D393|nr:hypothetical protein [Aliiglaciecola sp. LCG003]WJG09766.1 hypothetical protein QR722_01625 [Aliiglaciecola sp. LCG003]
MTKLHEADKHQHIEQQFSDLYQGRKNKIQSPSSVKRRVLQDANKGSNWYSMLNRFQHVAIAAGTLLLISLVALQFHQLQNPIEELSYTTVELHSLDGEKGADFGQIRRLYSQHYNDYLQQKAFLALHHQKSAILQQLDDGWELKTCNQELVKISKQVVETLQKMNLVGMSLKSGDSVQIAFNASGLIVGLHPSKIPLVCS